MINLTAAEYLTLLEFATALQRLGDPVPCRGCAACGTSHECATTSPLSTRPAALSTFSEGSGDVRAVEKPLWAGAH